MTCKLSIVGKPKQIKQEEDGTYIFMMTVDTSKAVPKGLKFLGQTVYRVAVNKKTFEKVKDDIKEDTEVIVNGEQKAVVTKSNKPFIYVNCFQLLIKPPKIAKDIKIDVKKENTIKEKEISLPIKNKDIIVEPTINTNKTNKRDVIKNKKSKRVSWVEQVGNDLVEIETKKIVITEKVHIYSKSDSLKLNFVIKHRNITLPIAVRPLGDGTYSVIAGVTRYYQAKILDVPTLKCYVTNLSRKDFFDKFYEKSLDSQKEVQSDTV